MARASPHAKRSLMPAHWWVLGMRTPRMRGSATSESGSGERKLVSGRAATTCVYSMCAERSYD